MVRAEGSHQLTLWGNEGTSPENCWETLLVKRLPSKCSAPDSYSVRRWQLFPHKVITASATENQSAQPHKYEWASPHCHDSERTRWLKGSQRIRTTQKREFPPARVLEIKRDHRRRKCRSGEEKAATGPSHYVFHPLSRTCIRLKECLVFTFPFFPFLITTHTFAETHKSSQLACPRPPLTPNLFLFFQSNGAAQTALTEL